MLTEPDCNNEVSDDDFGIVFAKINKPLNP